MADQEAADTTNAPKSFRIAVLADLHHEDEECDAWFSQLFRKLRSQNPDLCLVLGDLTNSGKPESFATIKGFLKTLNVPVHPIPGNHDCDFRGDTSVYRSFFPDFMNYSFGYRDWQFIAFDSNNGTAYRNVSISRTQLDWLEDTAKAMSPEKPTLLFTHFPLHTSVKNSAANPEEVFEALSPLNLKLALSGHFHGDTHQEHGTTHLFTQPCLSQASGNHDGTQPKGYVLFDCDSNGSWQRNFVTFEGKIEN